MAPHPPHAPASDTARDVAGERTLAAVAYLLTLITGLAVFLLVRRDDHYARWHALQAIGLGIVVLVLNLLLGLLGLGVALGRPGTGALLGLFGVNGLFGLLVVVLVVVLAIKAYQGERVRLPLIADFADRNA